MAWKDRLDNIKFSITTGDGKIYYPLWKTAEKSKEFNVSSYDFINVEGTFVDRKKARGSKFPLVFYFQGEDNIEQCDKFEASANDNRIWTVVHPFYGTIKGQPTNLKRNDSSYNVTEITIDFWESITEDYPFARTSAPDSAQAMAQQLNNISLAQTVGNSAPQTSDILTVKDSIILTASKHTPDPDSFNDYKNKVKTAIKTADDLVTDTEVSLKNAQSVINAPIDFAISVKEKINSYTESYFTLKGLVKSLFDKYYFESQASSILSAMCLSALNPGESDYIVRDDIESVNNAINDIYNDYLSTIDNNQVSIYENNSWSPNSFIQSNLSTLINFTANSLFQISFDARQERLYELKEDSNLILLTHRFIGLDANDENIESFRRINNIKNDELFRVKKGRVIKYFV